jgi:hypothetical protein
MAPVKLGGSYMGFIMLSPLLWCVFENDQNTLS